MKKMFNIKKLLFILILTFNFQTLTKADDIKDFQIEGISIGDSFYNHFNDKNIKLHFPYKKNTFGLIVPKQPINDYKNFDHVQLHLKNGDSNYRISSIEGHLRYYDNIKECYPKKNKIVDEIKNLFPNAEIQNRKSNHYLDKTGKSKVDATIFWIDTGEVVRIECYDWSKDFNYGDKLSIAILDTEITNFFMSE